MPYVCSFCLHPLELLLLVLVSADTRMWDLAAAYVCLLTEGDTTSSQDTVVHVKSPILISKGLLMPRWWDMIFS